MSNIGTYIKASDLPADLLGRLEAVTINSGANFLSGKVTSAFAKEKEIVNNTITSVNTLISPEVLKSISTELIEHAVTVTTNELSSYIKEKTSELLDFNSLLPRLTESITYWTKENILSMDDILSTINTKINIEKDNQKNNDDQKNKALSDLKDNISYKVGQINDFYQNNINKLNAGLETITAYITNGPDWIITTTNSYVYQVINKVEGFVGQQVNSVLEYRDNTIDNLGKKIGTSLAQPINEKAISTAKKAKANSEKLIAIAQTKVLNGLTKAIMVVRELTGIAIPPVYPKLSKLTELLN